MKSHLQTLTNHAVKNYWMDKQEIINRRKLIEILSNKQDAFDKEEAKQLILFTSKEKELIDALECGFYK